jgi:hypothetical protein
MDNAVAILVAWPMLKRPARIGSALVSSFISIAGSVAADAVSAAKGKREADYVWTIGVYTGASPFELRPPSGARNPIFTAADTGADALDTFAHPFLAIEGGRFHLFFTAMSSRDGRRVIGHAESADGLAWKYRGIVLREPAALSYPCVFQWQGNYYMVPESTDNVLRLYRATRFPEKWEREVDLLKADKLVSPTVFPFNGRWWMFVGISNAAVRLFHADGLKGPWTEHPRSPIVANDASIARPAGPPMIFEGKLHRLAQDCEPTYGNAVRAFEITKLSATEYAEKAIDLPLVSAASSGWNAAAMHHVDAQRVGPDRWLAAVDARGAPLAAPTH